MTKIINTKYNMVELPCGKVTNSCDKLDYWLMFIEGDLSLEELQELLLDYV